MKSKKLIQLIRILLISLVLSDISMAQNSCTNPSTLIINTPLMGQSQTTSEFWYKFTASSNNMFLDLAPNNSTFYGIDSVIIYNNDCSGLIPIQFISKSLSDTVNLLELHLTTLTPSVQYLIKVSKTTYSSVNYDMYLFVSSASACNLLDNGDFNTPPCPTSTNLSSNPNMPFLNSWYPNGQTPDYFNTCAPTTSNVNPNYAANNLPLPYASSTGGYIGLYCGYGTPGWGDHREYATGTMVSMTSSKKYYISMQYAKRIGSKYAMDKLGIYLSTSHIYNTSTNPNGGVFLPTVTPQINSTSMLTNTTWNLMGSCYQASGGESFVTIGNFYSTAGTNYSVTNATGPYDAYYLIDNVQATPLDLDISPSTTICLGASATLTTNLHCPLPLGVITNTAGVITNSLFVWTPTNGLSSNTGTTTVASPTATTIYTITLTIPPVNSNGSPCTITNTVLVTVIPPPSLTLSISPSSTICAGNSVTLSVNGAVTYTWSTSETTNSITVTPTTSTTYTVVGANTCGQTFMSATINVVPNPTLTVSANPTVICSGSSSTLTATGAVNYTWMPGGITSSIAVVSPTATTIYTVTGANGNCTTTQTVMVTVNSNLCCQTPVITFTTGTISSQTTATSYGAVLIAVNGTLTINTPNFTFTRTQIRMAPNSKIIIAPSCTVSLIGAHLFSCTNMWEGIEMYNNSRLITNRTSFPYENPSIDDANIGIYVNANSMASPANMVLNYLQLSKNHIGIKIENYTGTATYPFAMGAVTIQGDVSTSFSPGTILKPYISPAGIINYPTTEYGVHLINVKDAVVGSFTGVRNNFKKMQHGVRMVASNAKIIRIDFSDLTSNYNNKAIWAVGSYANSNPVTSPYMSFGTKYRMSVGVGTSNYCTFKNLKNGIYADSCMTNYIQNNTFNDINGTGISVYRSNFNYALVYNNNNPPMINFYDRDTTWIDNNIMKPITTGANVMQNGIGMFDNYYMYSLVSNNTMTLNPASGVWSEGVGVYHASNNYYSAYSTLTNTIIGNGNYGVHEVNNAYNLINAAGAGGPRSIANNTITVGTGACSGFFNTPNVGVYSVNSPYATIKENIIDETSLGGLASCMIGVYISNGQQDYIGCNLMKNNSISCAVDQNNINSVFRGNVMNYAQAGLYLVGGTMGNLGSSTSDAGQNEWINNAFSTYLANGAGSNIYYDGPASIGNPRWPNNNILAGTSIIPFTLIPSTNGALGCTQYHKGGNGSLINQKDDNDGLISSIIQNNVSFPNYNQGLLWEHKNGILNLLKDSLIDNTVPLFAQFKQQNSNSKLGKINSLMRSLGNYADVAQNKNTYLQSLNNIGAATNVVEQNYTTFMSTYINNIVGASQINGSAINTIKQLAQQCPYSDGAVVYNARALLKVWGDNELYVNACESKQLPQTFSSRDQLPVTSAHNSMQHVLVYPNPNNGTFSIAYNFEESLNTFVLFDLMGRNVAEKTLNGNDGVESINLQTLENGVYFYKVTNTAGKLLFTGKIIIGK